MTLVGNPVEFFVAFGAGVAVSFTPCVYSLLPVTIGYMGANAQGSRLKGLWISLIYALGVSVTYSALGIIASLTGRIFGEISNNFWAYFILGVFYFLFGLMFLDVFHISFFDVARKNIKPKGIFSIFLFGLVSGLAVSPCVFPALGAILTFVASKQNVFYGVALLFSFSYGMCTLLILAGTFSGVLLNLPKSGLWMVKIKKVGGIILIGVGAYFLIQAGRFFYG